MKATRTSSRRKLKSGYVIRRKDIRNTVAWIYGYVPKGMGNLYGLTDPHIANTIKGN